MGIHQGLFPDAPPLTAAGMHAKINAGFVPPPAERWYEVSCPVSCVLRLACVLRLVLSCLLLLYFVTVVVIALSY